MLIFISIILKLKICDKNSIPKDTVASELEPIAQIVADFIGTQALMYSTLLEVESQFNSFKVFIYYYYYLISPYWFLD